MHAWLCENPVGVDALTWKELPTPVPQATEVLVEIKAASLNFPDLLIVQNKYQMKPALPFVPGSEYAGVVEAVGEGVTSVKPGDQSFIMQQRPLESDADARRLTTRTRLLADLMSEADHFAGQASAALTDRPHVDAALDARRHRHERVRQRHQEEILRGQLLVSTTGSHVGQINGLAVVMLGEGTFAHPVRITATVRMGEGEVIDIEREVELGGPIHSKGVLILASFLAARFGFNTPLSLKASLVFEQSYGGVEGDSASLAELVALMSALSGIPIRQSLAVTGSVNQFGVVQPVGGINEKIEGFFDICAARGLTGDQGVLIPAPNVMHLMLRPAVVDAVRGGRFGIWAVSNVDQALELLTGIPAGEPNDKGEIPAGSVNFQVAVQLAELARLRQSYSRARSQPRRRRKAPAKAAKKPPSPSGSAGGR